MDVVETQLKPPENFKFPFTPYDIQKEFMRELYETIEGRKLGIFESPTGTGKSMSLICGSLAWLIDHEERTKRDVNKKIGELNESMKKLSTDSNWLDAHAAQVKDKQKRDLLQDYLNKINRKEEKLENIRVEAEKIKTVNRKRISKSHNKHVKYNNKENENDKKLNEDDEINTDDILLDDELYYECKKVYKSDSESESDDEEEYNGVKIFICSRTHSQLSQLVHEIQKSPYSSLKISVVSLSSRQNYCINENVSKLKNLALINERCQDLHSKKPGNVTKKTDTGEKLKKQKLSSGCPYYQQTNLENMRLKILTEIQDVEEVAWLGKELKGCPYYASRSCIEDAKIVLVPYNTILHQSTRTASKINLKDSVVIIDEAHNLMDAIANIHSSLVSGYHLLCAHSQLVQYRDKFHNRFTPYNLLHLNQIIYILKCLIRKIGGNANSKPDAVIGEESKTTVETMHDFTLSCEIDNINLFEILEFTKKSRITHKLHGFALKYKPSVAIRSKVEHKGVSSFLKSFGPKPDVQEPEEEEEEDQIEGNPLVSVIKFLESLTNHFDHGRIVCSKARTVRDSYIKFLLLNPAAYFTDVVKEARSVILAGGTMEPISEFTEQLFLMAGAETERINIFTCGHVIQQENILPVIVSSGPTGKTFDFSYQNRNRPETIEELGRLLVNVANVVPAGIVCFFPSYDYENFIYKQLSDLNLIKKLEMKKKVLREPKKSNEAEEVLREYSKCAKEGAILLSVVGGKLSEGLNFNDDLGRCVIVVGMPYPNVTNPELREKMNYLNATVRSTSGKEYYENLCMKAVNQSIGRSVRHKEDYASVLLVDHRYARLQCRKSLPKWIQESLRVEAKFGSVVGLLAKFFNSKRGPGKKKLD